MRALEALADELASSNEHTEIAVVGGAALVLLFNAREATKDVDVCVIASCSSESIRAAARRVGESMGLPLDWLNDAAKGYIHGFALGDVVLRSRSLTVRTIAPKQLLAMKLCAWRDDVDIDDARLLLGKLTGTREEIWKLVEPHLLPGRELKAQYAFEDLWEAERGTS